MAKKSTDQIVPLAILVLLGHVPMLIALTAVSRGLADPFIDEGVKNASGFVQVAAAFSFSMMGFMAAVMALFSVVGQSRAFRKYRENGLLKLLLIAVAITLAELAISFVASLQLFLVVPSREAVTCVMMTLLASFGMVVVTSIPIVSLQIRSASEKR